MARLQQHYREKVAPELMAKFREQAERFGLPYESARAHYEIGRHLEPTHPDRSAHLTRAEAEFRRLLIEPDIRRVHALLYRP